MLCGIDAAIQCGCRSVDRRRLMREKRIMEMDKLSRAICFATEAFDGMRRKAENNAAIFHSLEAAAIVQSVYDDEDAVCAAVLHDTVEDAGKTLSEISEQFGDRVSFLVSSETEDKLPERNPSETWWLRKERTLATLKQSKDMGVHAMWLGDKLSNMRSLARLKERLGNDMWGAFNQKDPNAHYKYYQTIAEELVFFTDTVAYREYVALINKVFER